MSKTRRIEALVELVRILAAIGIAYGIALVTLFVISDAPVFIIQQFMFGPLSSARRMGSVINLAVPFTFTGLCFCFMYAVNKFNLSGEGIFMFAGCMVSLIAISLGNLGLPAPLMVFILLAVGMAVGFLVSLIPAWLDAKFHANIVVVSLMLNSILAFLSVWVLKYFMRDPSIGSLGSFMIPESAKLPMIFGRFRIQSGVFIALIATVIVAILFSKTIFGYKMRVVGNNADFARASGINMVRTIILAQLVGGMFAGLGGACEILGNYDRYKWASSTQHGFDGLMVAVLARRNPVLVPIAAILLAYIRIGADVVNSKGDIPIEFITVIQGIVILLVAAEEFMGRYKKKLIYKAAEEDMKKEREKELQQILAATKAAEAGKGSVE